jgi:hypothetical protein
MEDILYCLRDCPHSKELWLRLNMGRYNNFFSEFDVKVWLREMTKDTSSILFVTDRSMVCLVLEKQYYFLGSTLVYSRCGAKDIFVT